MSSRFEVTVADMQSAISDLTDKNSQFKSSVTDLEGRRATLAGMWEGEANTAFNTAFSNDKGQWDTFASLVDNYIEALQSILQTYQAAEDANTQTATARPYSY